MRKISKMTGESATFRDFLKLETQEAHDRLDGMLSGLDLTSLADLGSFLSIHQNAFATLRDHNSHGGLEEMVAALESDLAQLGLLPSPPRVARAYERLALSYILEGSRMGTKVLRKRWQKAQDPMVRAAAAYFTLEAESGGWRALCDELAGVPVGSELAKRIVSDAREIFGLFTQATLAQEPALMAHSLLTSEAAHRPTT